VRENKFRVIANGETYYWGFIDGVFIAPTFGDKLSISKVNELSCLFTGIYDKKGNPIYEGDIYHQGDKNIKYVVVWHDSGLIGKQCGSSSYAGLEYWKDKIEVIGNIYENADLIKK
jgi:hypothetical protein